MRNVLPSIFIFAIFETVCSRNQKVDKNFHWKKSHIHPPPKVRHLSRSRGRPLPRSPFPQSLIPMKPSVPVTAFYQRQPPAIRDLAGGHRGSHHRHHNAHRTDLTSVRHPHRAAQLTNPSRDGAPTPLLRRERGLRPHGKGPGARPPSLPPNSRLTDPAGARKHVRLPREDRSPRPQRQWEVCLPLSPSLPPYLATRSLTHPQIVPPPPLHQKRMALPLLPNHRRRVRQQNYPHRHRLADEAHKAAALGHRRHRTLPLRLTVVLPRRRGRDLGVRHHVGGDIRGAAAVSG